MRFVYTSPIMVLHFRLDLGISAATNFCFQINRRKFCRYYFFFFFALRILKLKTTAGDTEQFPSTKTAYLKGNSNTVGFCHAFPREPGTIHSNLQYQPYIQQQFCTSQVKIIIIIICFKIIVNVKNSTQRANDIEMTLSLSNNIRLCYSTC